MTPLKVALDIKKRSEKEKRRKNSSFLSSTIRVEYNLYSIAYGVRHIGLWLVELFEALLE